MPAPSPFDLVAAGRIHIAGGLPSTIPDVPICAVFLAFYVAGAAGNVTMFIRYGKRLRWQMALFGYCMSRITTMATRIAWSQHINNSGLAIASQVFLNAGVLLIFLVNLMMSKKLIFRTHYEYFQANSAKKVVVKKAFAAAGFLLLPFLALTITGAIQGFLTSDLDIQHKDTILKRVGVVAFFIYCTLPFFLVAFNAVWRLRAGEPSEAPEKVASPGIGIKSWQSNRTVWKNSAIILLVASLVTFEYGIKLAQGFGDATVDKWYYGKGAFYATSLLPETLAMFTLLLSNMPKRYAGLALMPLENKLEDRLEVEASEKGHSF